MAGRDAIQGKTMNKNMAENCRFSLLFSAIRATFCQIFVHIFALYCVCVLWGVGDPGIFLNYALSGFV